MNHVLTTVIRRFVLVYGEPKTNDIEGFYAEYQRALKGFSEAVLQAGVDDVIRDHTFPTWPTVGEVYKAVSEQGRRLHRPTPEPPEPDWQRTPPTDADRARNHELMERLRRATAQKELDAHEGVRNTSRPVMEDLQAAAVRTEDGRRRHLKNYIPRMPNDGDAA